MAGARWRTVWNATLYSSGTVVLTGDTGVITTPFSSAAGSLIIPVSFHCVGSDQLTDETNVVKIDWYADAGGLYTFGTTTFAEMNAGDMAPPPLGWPGDVTFWDIDYTDTDWPPNPPYIPLPPYHKITHTLVGTTKSMSYIVYMHYMVMA